MSNAATLKFKLISGISCEAKELTGKEQRLLTEQKERKDNTDNILEMLESVIIRVGSNTQINKDFVKNMLSGDRKKVLTAVRKFSMRETEQEEKFVFNYKYTDKDKNKATHELEVDLTNDFPEKEYKLVGEDGKAGEIMSFEEYDQVPKEYSTVLPRTKKLVRLKYLTGHGESVGASIKKNDRSSHTSIIMRSPKEVTTAQNGEDLLLVLNLDTLPMVDVEHLRKLIKDVEGDIDTVVEFEHPEAESKLPNEKMVRVNLLEQTAFFFPSEAI